MKIEDLAVAAENAAKTEQVLADDVVKFVEFAHKVMGSDEYQNMCAVCNKIGKTAIVFQAVGDGIHFKPFGIGFNVSSASDTPFLSLKTEIYGQALSLEETAREWFCITDSHWSRRESTSRFWKALFVQILDEAYRYRMQYDPDFREGQIARNNEEYAAWNKAESKKSWRFLAKMFGILVVAAALVMFPIIFGFD